MKAGTFGDSNQFKMLKPLHEELDKLDSKQRYKICRMIGKFDSIYTEMKKINNKFLYNYIKENLIRDFKNFPENKLENYSKGLITHLKCFFAAKINNLKN